MPHVVKMDLKCFASWWSTFMISLSDILSAVPVTRTLLIKTVGAILNHFECFIIIYCKKNSRVPYTIVDYTLKLRKSPII